MFYRTKIQVKRAKGVLTKRQIEILKLVARGKTNQEIADELIIGKATVETPSQKYDPQTQPKRCRGTSTLCPGEQIQLLKHQMSTGFH